MRGRAVLPWLFGVALAACAEDVPAQRQWIVVVDTDAVVLDARGPTLSNAAVIDTVRVDLLDAQNIVQDVRELAVTSSLDWPLSFGMHPAPDGPSPPVRIRVRGFRARDAESTIERGKTTLAPPPELTIDRVVDLAPLAPDVVRRILVRLGADCFGQPPSFPARTTCIDGRSQPFDTPLPEPTATTSVAGTSPIARVVPCAGAAAPGRICIPGGLSILGSTFAAGLEDGVTSIPSLPARLVRVSPFFMDETEMTVGRARRWIGMLRSPAPFRPGAPEVHTGSEACTFSDAAAADRLPLNCVLEATANELCALEGGTLPTEAQWNHAATGRGDGRRYPWGDTNAVCCSASVSRGKTSTGQPLECGGDGPEAAGSHRPSDACGGIGDVSLDGVLDLGGSLTEMLLDRSRRLDDACFGPRFGILVDPRCDGTVDEPIATRGGSWAAGSERSQAAIRGRAALGSDRGFRCVYRDGAP